MFAVVDIAAVAVQPAARTRSHAPAAVDTLGPVEAGVKVGVG